MRRRTVHPLTRAARLAAGVIAAAVLGAAGAAVPSVIAAPAAGADSNVTLVGHGFGHGRGMGQWGAQGYAAMKGWTSAQILDHFYGGTVPGTIDENEIVSVRLMGQEGRDLVVTSGAPFNVPGIGQVDAGRGVRIHWTGTEFQMFVAYTYCNGDEVPGYNPIYPGGAITSTVADPGNDINRMLTICNEDGAGHNVSYRGSLRYLLDSGAVHAVNDVTYWQYLRGTVPRESPSSWSPAALEAQAVAARSYAKASNRYPYAKLCDTTACQVYGGAGNNGTYIEAASTNNAVQATAGIVRVGNGAVMATEYSASTGGYTAGGAFPAVPDEGDAIPSNPSHTWTVNLSADAIAARYGIGKLQGIVFTGRNGLGDMGGRVTSMQIVGTTTSVSRTGPGFAADWGLRSDWFGTPNGSGLLVWYLRNDDSSGSPDIMPFAFGSTGDTPVVGDWKNGPVDGIGVYRDGTWYLRNTASPGPAEITVAYGAPGYQPVVGRWTAGVTGIGVYVKGNWFLRNSVSPGAPTASFAYGAPWDIPVVGDWNGDGIDTVGVYENGTWYLRNSNTPGPPDLVVSYGVAGYTPITGVWAANPPGAQTIGVYTGGWWYLRNSISAGPPAIRTNYGAAGYLPVRGNWSGGTIHGIGVVVPG